MSGDVEGASVRNSRVGFIGLGNMGKGMATNLVKAGFNLTVYDIRPEPVKELVKLGASEVPSLAELARTSDIIITSLPSPKVSESVIFSNDGLFQNSRQGQLLILMDTIPPSMVRRIAEAFAKKGVKVLDAPVTGGVGPGPVGANEGTLTIMVGGEEGEFERCKPLFNAVGTFVVHAGGLGSGQVTKLINNYLSFCNYMSMAEGIVLGVKAGVSAKVLYEVISRGTGRSHAVEWRLPNQVAKHKFDSGIGPYELMLKDFDVILGLAKETKTPLFMGTLARELYQLGAIRFSEKTDYASVIQLLEEYAGVTVSFD